MAMTATIPHIVRGPSPDFQSRKSSRDLMPPKPDPVGARKTDSRRPAWRWERAELAYQQLGGNTSRYPTRRTDDPLFIQFVLPFCELHTKAINNYEKLLELKHEHPGMVWAKDVVRDRKDNLKRWMIEASLCAGLSAAEIAEEQDVPEDHIFWYEKMFFDIRSIIDNPTLMMTGVFAPALTNQARVEDFLWKSVAWKHGLGMEGLRELVDPTEGFTDQTTNMLKRIIEKKMATDTVLALQTRQVNSFNNNLIIDQFQRAVEAQKDGDVGNTSSKLEGTMGVFIEHMTDAMHVAPLTIDFNGVEGSKVLDAPGSDIFTKRRAENVSRNPTLGTPIDPLTTAE